MLYSAFHMLDMNVIIYEMWKVLICALNCVVYVLCVPTVVFLKEAIVISK